MTEVRPPHHSVCKNEIIKSDRSTPKPNGDLVSIHRKAKVCNTTEKGAGWRGLAGAAAPFDYSTIYCDFSCWVETRCSETTVKHVSQGSP